MGSNESLAIEQPQGMEQPQAKAQPQTKDRAQTRRRAVARPWRFLYSAAAALLFVATFLGFQLFYTQGRAFPGRELTPPIRPAIIAHGVSMSLWILLFVAQPVLIAARRPRLHMTLGKIGAGLAVGIVASGLWVAIAAARVNPPELKLWGLEPQQFVAVPFFSILLFGAFVAIGVWKRRRPEIHRPMMLLATLAAIPAALDRIPPIPRLYQETVLGTLFGPFLASLAIGLVFLVVKRLTAGAWNRWFVGGFAALATANVLIMALAHSGAWNQWMTALLR